MPPHRWLWTAMVIALAVLVWGAFFWQPAALSPNANPHGAGLTGQASAQGGDFTLTSAAGPVSLTDYRGKVVVIYFGYTFCPDACPTSLAALAAAFAQLAPYEAARANGILVGIDPERDTLAILKDYAPYFHPAITGVTGTPQEIAAVARQYGVIYSKQRADAAGNYAVDHSSLLYVVGPDGKLAHTLAHGASPAAIAAAIQSALKSTKPRARIS